MRWYLGANQAHEGQVRQIWTSDIQGQTDNAIGCDVPLLNFVSTEIDVLCLPVGPRYREINVHALAV